MDFLADIWNAIMGNNLIEPTFWIYVGFVMFFVVIPICVAVATFKVIRFLVSCILGE